MALRSFLLVALASVVPIYAQGVVGDTAEIRYQIFNPEPKGTIIDQAKWIAKNVKGKVLRYRVFVRTDADVGLLSTVLRAPVLSIIRVAGIPVPNQKLSVEAVTTGGRNPAGLAFISGQGVAKDGVILDMKPLVDVALTNLDKALVGVQLAPPDVITVSCFVSSLKDAAEVNTLTAEHFPKASVNVLQIAMPYGKALAECEAVAAAKGPLGYVYPEGLTKSPNFTQVVGINTRRIAYSALYGAAPCTADATKAMFAALQTDLAKLGANIKEVAFSHLYPNTEEGVTLTRQVRFDFYNKEKAPASTLVNFLGFTDRKPCTGVEVVAPVP
jgi:enamine deaminase RidA (YjgF/YER057c/UK114 family)